MLSSSCRFAIVKIVSFIFSPDEREAGGLSPDGIAAVVIAVIAVALIALLE